MQIMTIIRCSNIIPGTVACVRLIDVSYEFRDHFITAARKLKDARIITRETTNP